MVGLVLILLFSMTCVRAATSPTISTNNGKVIFKIPKEQAGAGLYVVYQDEFGVLSDPEALVTMSMYNDLRALVLQLNATVGSLSAQISTFGAQVDGVSHDLAVEIGVARANETSLLILIGEEQKRALIAEQALANSVGDLSDALDDESSARFTLQSNALAGINGLNATLQNSTMQQGLVDAGQASLLSNLGSQIGTLQVKVATLESVSNMTNVCGRNCYAGEYVSSPCTETSPTQCSKCPSSTYSLGGLPEFCRNWTVTCVNGATYQSKAPSSTSDRSCSSCSTTCPLSNQYISSACTSLSNLGCTNCSVCTNGTSYQTTPCTLSTNRVCTTCRVCDANFEIETQACTPTSNTVCQSKCVPYPDTVLSIGSLAPAAGAPAQEDKFAEGTLYATNRDCYTVNQIPSKYLGLTYLRGDNDKVGTVSFTTSNIEVAVFVALDGRSTMTGILDSRFTPTGEKLVIGGCHAAVDFPIYRAFIPGGSVSFTISEYRVAMLFVGCASAFK